ncbi:serine O-acetyltransferase [Synoicihabitans lomoniglobus]|uniref:Serine O-acetyltransferase n=1 Tax=Synoicihabitans lomoniglobus TaxID=2909285 RepID=A0AAF0CQ99_9BACT|nr:serine O-acetyltransferase [Opitutaceae bacterium LMO-M01]WED66086.1 serine O-acetyltransferase [Opitutaceae bacterium LMO-M01]
MTLDDIQRDLLASYENQGGINHIDGSNLPSDQSVNWLAAEIMHLIFPGFFEHKALAKSDVPAITAARLKAVCQRLEAEVAKALKFANDPDPVPHAEEIACALLQKLPSLRDVCQTDVQAAYEGDPAARSVEEIIVAYPCVLVISLQRVAHELYLLKVPLLPRMLTEYAHERTGTDIHPGAQIGSHFFIDHCTGVVIGETARIGNHVKIYQNVTLGAKSFELDENGNPVKGVKRHPDIEDHVTVYPSATILGGKTVIGRNSIIGSNVWLMKSVPADSIVYYEGDRTSVVRNQADRKKKNEPEVEGLDWSI